MINQKELSKFVEHPKLQDVLKSITDYNNGMDEINQFKLDNEDRFQTKALNDMVGKKKSDLQTKFIKISNDLVSSTSESLRSEKLTLTQKLYPLTSSNNGTNIGSERTAGEFQLAAARELLNSGKFDKVHLQKILDELELAIDMGRIDFASYVFEKLNLDDKPITSDLFQFRPELLKLYDGFMVLSKAKYVKENIIALKVANSLATEFNIQVIQGTAHALFPMSIEEIKEQDRSKPNGGVSDEVLRRMNESVAFWANAEKIVTA